LIPGKNISVFSKNFVLKIQNSKKFGRNSPKFTGIPFPPITGILPENEMVNPAATSPYPPVQ